MTLSPKTTDLLAELSWRGLLHQATNEQGLRAHLADPASHPRRAYAGFDPTADSLTIGNLVPIILLRHLQLAGHTPIVLAGGGTGLIGDPSGKNATRKPLSREDVLANARTYEEQVFKVLDRERTEVRFNSEWFGRMAAADMIRDDPETFGAFYHFATEGLEAKLKLVENTVKRPQ